VPYVWGGKSPKGFDCSGLVQFVFGLHGVRLPRDSDQQYACGVRVRDPAPGDLLFFGREGVSHVGVALGGRDFLHARGEVRRNSLDPASPLHDAELAALLLGARRVLPHRR
jgi:cell wall-associated NlpC family hydrolase